MKAISNPGGAGDGGDAAASLPDAALVEQCRMGNQQAFVELVQRHQSLVCATAYGITGSLPLSLDVAQDCFVRVWRKLDELREPGKFRGWVCRIASSLAYDAMARERRHLRLATPGSVEAEGPQAPDDAAVDQEEAALVWRTLSQLPEPLRLPLILYYREGENVAAVARAMELNEDAVKQRLARGRAALREKLDHLTAEVLTRSRPGALFTFAVLATAGLLTPPARIAAAAFAASVPMAGAGGAGMVGSPSTGTAATTSAVGTPGFSSSSTSAWFPLMSFSPIAPVAALAMGLLCIPAGWTLQRRSLEDAAQSGKRPVVSGTGRAAAIPNLNESPLIAEWRRLHEVHGSTSASMPVLFEVVAALQDPFRKQAFRAALLAEWAEIDPAGGLEWLGAKPDRRQHLPQFLREWLPREPEPAVRALMAGRTPSWKETAQALLPEIARSAPGLLAELVQQLPEPGAWEDQSTAGAFRIAAEANLSRSLKGLELLSGKAGLYALSGVATAWGGMAPQDAWKWAESLKDPEEKQAALRGVLAGWAKLDPLAALERLPEVAPGGDPMMMPSDSASAVLREAAARDFEETLRWLSANPGKIGLEGMSGLSESLTARLVETPAATLNLLQEKGLPGLQAVFANVLLNDGFEKAEDVREWIRDQPDNPFVQGVRQHLYNAAALHEPALLIHWVREMNPADISPALLDSVAMSLIQSGRGMSKVETLLPSAPPDLAKALVRAGFSQVSNWSDQEIQPWLARLNQLEDPQARLEATGRIAGGWAAADPDGAAEWAADLPDPEARARGFAGIAGRWAAADRFEASRWIATLPAGAERDAAAGALVSAISKSEPDSAFEWARTIADPEARRESLTLALVEWARTDLAGAQEVVAGSSLPAAEQEELQRALGEARAGPVLHPVSYPSGN